MSVDSSVDRRDESQTAGNGNGNGVVTVCNRSIYSSQRLRLNRNEAHQSENYDDLDLDFNSSLYGKLEQYLPPNMLTVARDVKLEFMKEILDRYLTEHDRIRPLHKQIYDMHPTTFFVPSFIKAITENTEESLRSIISEPSPGVYTFEMLQPDFCELLLSEVESFEKWVQEAKFKIMRPNTMNKYGAVLDDFGLETMLDHLMNNFIRPISKVFFPEVGGTSLDSHHGFVVEYGKDRDYELGFHVDDSEVTLNVCLGKQFSGGELFFRGVRCDKHVNTDTQPEEVFDYSHVPGHGVLHRGRHRHGARPTTSGHRTNLLLWCRSSVFRESRKYQRDFPNWCGECLLEKKERQRQSVEATKKELLKREGEPMVSVIP
ncbi:2-oxoglutarate and iron-dependent oxygenase domain-containing protein [Thalictrum thalictroides]|uniref:2-oxoglutarate and iron-dependent oxygenase domain-containing protein n=1 Tax=Thalictrum thalictroides TaxID=46969 RepID=A0A7J6V8L4_THATH|nr:2-oxoglutarate and iron-dependent oxygenase domain-containing protein [Thalictrum thalictroides]